MSESTKSKNKALVLEVFDTLFNKRDYAAAERFWSPNYIQHSADIEPATKVSSTSSIYSRVPQIRTGPDLARRRCHRPRAILWHRTPENWIAADIVRIADGVLADIGTSSRIRRLARS